MTGSRILHIIKRISEEAKAFILSKNVFIFLFFVIAATIFWAVNSLNRVSDHNYTINVKYVNIPKDIEFSADLPPYITVKLRDKGAVLWTLFQNPNDSLIFDFSKFAETKKSDNITIRTSTAFENQIKTKIAASTTIVDYDPSTILIEKGALKSKTVPVVLRSKLDCDDLYCFSGKPKLDPGSIKIYAPEELIDTIDTIYTETLKAVDLTDSLITNVAVVLPVRCKAQTTSIKVTVPVEIYIEGSITVPVKVINVPENFTIKPVPSEVTVKYNIGKSRYSKVVPSSFQLYIDYNDIIDSNSKSQYISVGKEPEGIINYKLTPESVEYIIL